MTNFKTSLMLYVKLKTLWSLSIGGIQLSQGYRDSMGGSLRFTSKSLEVLGTHLINPERMKG